MVNFVLLPDNKQKEDIEDLLLVVFDDLDTVEFLSDTKDMFDILVSAGIFKSRGDAKKNWQQTTKEVPFGMTDLIVGKKKTKIFIWRVIK